MKSNKRSQLTARERLASQLISFRKRAGISQEGLADLAGLHRTYVGGIERSERNVSIDNIEKLAIALKVDIRELFVDSNFRSNSRTALLVK
jgi:transcriptional regulator with XRE-family HTH domain